MNLKRRLTAQPTPFDVSTMHKILEKSSKTKDLESILRMQRSKFQIKRSKLAHKVDRQHRKQDETKGADL